MKENPQQLSFVHAFKRGADLWILSDSKHNFWNSKIDWYLSFQIKKQKLKAIQKSSVQTQSLLKKYQISSIQWKPSSAPLPLLIESSAYLPNLWTLEIPYTPQWLNNIYDTWCSLNQPSLRIFAPKEIKKEDIEKKWQAIAQNIPIQYIIGYTL